MQQHKMVSRKIKWMFALVFIALLVLNLPIALGADEASQEPQKQGLLLSILSMPVNLIKGALGMGGDSKGALQTIYEWKAYIFLLVIFFKIILPEHPKINKKLLFLAFGIGGIIIEMKYQGVSNPVITSFNAIFSFNFLRIIKEATSTILLIWGTCLVLFATKKPSDYYKEAKEKWGKKGGGGTKPDKGTEEWYQTELRKKEEELKRLENKQTKPLISAHEKIAKNVQQIFNSNFEDYVGALRNSNPEAANEIANEIINEIHGLIPEEKRAQAEEIAARTAARKGITWQR